MSVSAADFGHLEPMLDAAHRELEAAGVTERPETVLADAGYWHHEQMQRIVAAGTQALIPPDANKRKGNRPGRGRPPLQLHAQGDVYAVHRSFGRC